MDKIIEDNKEISKKLLELKNKILNIHIEANSTSSIEVMGEISKLKNVSDEVKEMLVLMHVNNVTATKFNNEAMVTNYNTLIDITNEIVEKQNDLIDILKKTSKPTSITGKINNAKTLILNVKYQILTTILGTGTILWLMYYFSPEVTEKVVNVILSLVKGVF